MVQVNKISEHKKTKAGSIVPESKARINQTVKGHGMYTFVYGNGSSRKSETKHCSEASAKQYKTQLEQAGY